MTGKEILNALADQVARRLRERQLEERLLDIREVARLLDVSACSVRYWSTKGLIPAPIRVGERALRWRLSEVLEWLRSRPRARRPQQDDGKALGESKDQEES